MTVAFMCMFLIAVCAIIVLFETNRTLAESLEKVERERLAILQRYIGPIEPVAKEAEPAPLQAVTQPVYRSMRARVHEMIRKKREQQGFTS